MDRVRGADDRTEELNWLVFLSLSSFRMHYYTVEQIEHENQSEVHVSTIALEAATAAGNLCLIKLCCFIYLEECE